jgi:MFS family permease
VYLHLTPLQFGLIDGLYQGGAALVRVAGGFVADRWQRHKEVAAAGYGLSAICKLGLLAVGSSWGGFAALTLLDRSGKGVRTAPRDAMISLSSPQDQLAAAFGVHRALDTVGAMIGPVIAFVILTQLPGAFDVVFVASFCAAVVGLSFLVLFVENPAVKKLPERARAISARATLALLATPRVRWLVFIGAVLSLMTMSDGFLYLGLQRRLDWNVGLFPLLYVATAFAYLLLSIPVGHLADRYGRGRVFVGGHVLLLIVYTSLLLPELGYLELAAYVLLYGAYYAATDGVLMALASSAFPADLRASGLALLTTATGLARVCASLLFGALWTWWGVETTALVFGAGLLAAICIAGLVIARTESNVPDAQAATP